MAIIMIFGASTTYGAWDKEGGWAARLRKSIDKKETEHLIYNLGISGDTTADLLERFEFETKQRLEENEETIFIFAIGVNDSAFLQSKNGSWIALEKFKNNIQKLITIAKQFSSKIVFLGLTPVDEKKTTPIPWNTDIFYKNEYTQKYNNIIKSICEKENVPFLGLFDSWSNIDYKKLLYDGLHPNSKGHEKIFRSLKDFLIKKKVIK